MGGGRHPPRGVALVTSRGAAATAQHGCHDDHPTSSIRSQSDFPGCRRLLLLAGGDFPGGPGLGLLDFSFEVPVTTDFKIKLGQGWSAIAAGPGQGVWFLCLLADELPELRPVGLQQLGDPHRVDVGDDDLADLGRDLREDAM